MLTEIAHSTGNRTEWNEWIDSPVRSFSGYSLSVTAPFTLRYPVDQVVTKNGSCSVTLPKRVNSARKEFAHRGANSSLEELATIMKEDTNEKNRVASLICVPTTIKQIGTKKIPISL